MFFPVDTHKNVKSIKSTKQPKTNQIDTPSFISDFIANVEQFLRSKDFQKPELKRICEMGEMGGFFFINNIIQLFKHLHTTYPQFVGPLFSIGQTAQGKDIPALTLGLLSNPNASNQTRKLEEIIPQKPRSLEDEASADYQKEKSNILFTALHHSREPLTLSMIVYIFLANLHALMHTNWETIVRSSSMFHDDEVGQIVSQKFFLFGNLVFVPAVNLDSYLFINEAYNTNNWHIAKTKRKNMNLNTPCEKKMGNDNAELKKIVLSGVDLNRNYDIKFDQDQIGSVTDPCDETFRGKCSIIFFNFFHDIKMCTTILKLLPFFLYILFFPLEWSNLKDPFLFRSWRHKPSAASPPSANSPQP